MDPEVRVDPLTGLKTIVAGDRAARPGGGFAVARAGADRPGRRPVPGGPRGPDAARGLRRAARRRRARHARLDGARGAEPLPGARSPGAPEPEPEANPDLFSRPPARGRARGDRQRARSPSARCRTSSAAQVAAAMEAWRARMRAHADAACRHLIVNERAEAGASLPHTHAQLYALGFVPAAIARERERFSAYAVRTMGSNLLGDLVQEEVRRRVADRRDRRRGGADGAVGLAGPVPADARAAPPRGALRGRRPAPAPRCCTTASRGCGACSAPRRR